MVIMSRTVLLIVIPDVLAKSFFLFLRVDEKIKKLTMLTTTP
jgi:hypothetical protein